MTTTCTLSLSARAQRGRDSNCEAGLDMGGEGGVGADGGVGAPVTLFRTPQFMKLRERVAHRERDQGS